MKTNLNKREIKLLIILLSILGAVYYNNTVFKPGRSRIKSLKESIKYMSIAKSDLKKEMPDLTSLRSEMKILDKKIAETKEHFEKIGNRIPRLSEFDQLLKSVTELNFDGNLKFLEISPQNKKNIRSENKNKNILPSEYLINEFNIIISGTFSAITNYTYFLENLSPFISITQAEIKTNIDKSPLPLLASIKISIILTSKTNLSNKQPAFNKQPLKPKSFQSPFLLPASEKKTPVVQKKNNVDIFSSFPKISGIVVFGDDLRVIIGDNVYKTGDSYDSFLIKDITRKHLLVEHKSGPEKKLLIK